MHWTTILRKLKSTWLAIKLKAEAYSCQVTSWMLVPTRAWQIVHKQVLLWQFLFIPVFGVNDRFPMHDEFKHCHTCFGTSALPRKHLKNFVETRKYYMQTFILSWCKPLVHVPGVTRGTLIWQCWQKQIMFWRFVLCFKILLLKLSSLFI